MIKEERQKEILKLLVDDEIIENELISQKLKIPMTTLRRDLNELEQIGKIIKLHGGIKNRKQKFFLENSLDNKIKESILEKQIIAKKAAERINFRDIIFLDSGSTTYYMIQFLDPKMELQIVTNSIPHAQSLMSNNHHNIYLLGGKINVNLGLTYGFEAIKSLRNFNFDKAFIGVNAIDGKELYTTSDDQAEIKATIIHHAKMSYVLALKDKLNSKSFYKFGSLSKTCKLITE